MLRGKSSQDYVPPLVVVGGIDSQQSLTVIVGYEAAANIGAMPTHSRVPYELNCSERMIRRLSTHFHIGGSEAFDEKTQDWSMCRRRATPRP